MPTRKLRPASFHCQVKRHRERKQDRRWGGG